MAHKIISDAKMNSSYRESVNKYIESKCGKPIFGIAYQENGHMSLYDFNNTGVTVHTIDSYFSAAIVTGRDSDVDHTIKKLRLENFVMEDKE